MRSSFLFGGILLLGLFFWAPILDAATHYVSGVSSVDGSIIAWGGTTTYSSQCSSGRSTWNALGKISITPDTIWTIEDLTYKDTSSRLYYWNGLWQQNFGADYVWLHTYNMRGYSFNDVQGVCTHEMGHALGLSHSIWGNVMYSSSVRTTLGAQDTSDYSYLYP